MSWLEEKRKICSLILLGELGEYMDQTHYHHTSYEYLTMTVPAGMEEAKIGGNYRAVVSCGRPLY